MKNLICGLLYIFCVCRLAAQQDNEYLVQANYNDNNMQYIEAIVIAPSGLKMRGKPDFTSKPITVIPYSERVKYSSTTQKEYPDVVYDADSVGGFWFHVSWKGKQGYAFSGYLGQGIFKMDKNFYLLCEQSAYCWDDAYISSGYNYYGVYPNKDTSSFTIKKLPPLFYKSNVDIMAGITFKFKQKQRSYFAFASKSPFPEGPLAVTTSQQHFNFYDNNLPVSKQKISVPNTSWEIKARLDTVDENGASMYPDLRLIIVDKTSGAWHYLFDKTVYFNDVSLRWCGDMDGDGVQDFMLDINTDHSVAMMLFLSKNAGKWNFVKLAGMYFWGDCC